MNSVRNEQMAVKESRTADAVREAQSRMAHARKESAQAAASFQFKVSRMTGRARVRRTKTDLQREGSNVFSRLKPIKDDSGLEAHSLLGRAWNSILGYASTDSVPSSRKASLQSKRLSSHQSPFSEGFPAAKPPRSALPFHAENIDTEEAETGIGGSNVTDSPSGHKNNRSDDTQERPLASTESDSEDEDTSRAARRLVRRLTKEYRVALGRQQLSMFLTKDGTLVSIFSKDGGEVTPSIVARLRSKNTLLRTSEDVSMLMQALLDVCVDKSLEIVDAFRRKLDMVSNLLFGQS